MWSDESLTESVKPSVMMREQYVCLDLLGRRRRGFATFELDRSRPGLNDVIVINAVVPRIPRTRPRTSRCCILLLCLTVEHLPPGNGEIRHARAPLLDIGRWAGTSLATPPLFRCFDVSCHRTDPGWSSWRVAPSDRFYMQNRIHWRLSIYRGRNGL